MTIEFFQRPGKKPALLNEPGGAGFSQETTAYSKSGLPDDHMPYGSIDQEEIRFPPGLVGEIAEFFLAFAARPVRSIAISTAIGIVAGVSGRAYNISGLGLNLYIINLAATGSGKDAVADASDALIGAISGKCPTAFEFQLPGELVSSAGIIRHFAEMIDPVGFSVLGEFGVKMKEMANPHASAHVTGQERILLQIYSKSGAGKILAGTARSDKEKSIRPITSPSFTIMAESVPDRFYELLDEAMIASGLLPRFLLWEYRGKRVYLNENRLSTPPESLVEKFAQHCGYCRDITAKFFKGEKPLDVGMTPEAATASRQYEHRITDAINANTSDTIKQLYNRAHEKVLKVAAIVAVGINRHFPVICIDCFHWAARIVDAQTAALVAKFEAGEVGAQLTDEGKQLQDVIRAISNYMTGTFHDAESKYGGVTFEMHSQGVVTQTHIQRRVFRLASFRKDRMGQTHAFKRAINSLLESDELRQIPKAQMQATYGTGSIGYCVSNPTRFLKGQ